MVKELPKALKRSQTKHAHRINKCNLKTKTPPKKGDKLLDASCLQSGLPTALFIRGTCVLEGLSFLDVRKPQALFFLFVF